MTQLGMMTLTSGLVVWSVMALKLRGEEEEAEEEEAEEETLTAFLW